MSSPAKQYRLVQSFTANDNIHAEVWRIIEPTGVEYQIGISTGQKMLGPITIHQAMPLATVLLQAADLVSKLED